MSVEIMSAGTQLYEKSHLNIRVISE